MHQLLDQINEEEAEAEYQLGDGDTERRYPISGLQLLKAVSYFWLEVYEGREQEDSASETQ